MDEDWRRVVDGQWLRDCMEEWRDWGHLVMRAKWTMDGATTLAEAAARFRERADELDDLARAGFELDQPVNDDFPWAGSATLAGGRLQGGETEDYPLVIRLGGAQPRHLGEHLAGGRVQDLERLAATGLDPVEGFEHGAILGVADCLDRE